MHISSPLLLSSIAVSTLEPLQANLTLCLQHTGKTHAITEPFFIIPKKPSGNLDPKESCPPWHGHCKKSSVALSGENE